MSFKKIFIAFTILTTTTLTSAVFALDIPKLFNFRNRSSLDNWQEKIFKDKVLYTVETAHQEGYLSAKSNQSCSGLFYKIRFNPRKFPMISWKWKVLKFPDKSKSVRASGGWVEKDDYPARVYVIFPSILFTNTKSIEYVWDETTEEETYMSSPYFKNIKIIVIESGKENLNRWVYEERNINDDYIQLFGKKPPNVGAIAIMTDADNTASSAEALYAEIKVGYKNE
ncbi:MAG: DUF3047 domain-containing protein [Candidatus Kaelpia imicola]|nr:DUF3047 domain-containing protein [Candidatus Kaelpia imicola]